MAVAATGVGCWWPSPGQGPDRRAHNDVETAISTDTVEALHLRWAAPTAGAAGAPVTSDAGVHVNDRGAAYGFRTDGAPMWTVGIPEEDAAVAAMVPVHARGDEVLTGYAGPGRGGVAEASWLSADSGAVVRDARVANSLRADVAAAVTRAIAPGYAGVHLSVTDVGGGTLRWSGLVHLDGIDSPPADAHVTVGADAVFHSGPGLNANADGFANAVRAFPIEGGSTSCGPPVAPFFACPTWITDLPGTTATAPVLSADGTTLYVGAGDVLHALDALTGAVQWTAPLGAPVAGPPAVANGRVFVPTTSGELVVVAADGCGTATCAAEWSGEAGSPLTVQPAVAGTGATAVVFTGSVDGGVDAFAAAGCGSATCAPLWSAPVGAGVTGAPAVSDGTVYYGTADGLVAFGL